MTKYLLSTYQLIDVPAPEKPIWERIKELHELAMIALDYGDLRGFREYLEQADLLELEDMKN